MEYSYDVAGIIGQALGRGPTGPSLRETRASMMSGDTSMPLPPGAAPDNARYTSTRPGKAFHSSHSWLDRIRFCH